jgi:hypothetical protein
MANQTDPSRELTFLLAGPERRLLRWIAARLPRWITSDQLTALGAMVRRQPGRNAGARAARRLAARFAKNLRHLARLEPTTGPPTRSPSIRLG